MASKVEICNRALQILGEAPITSLSDGSKAAASCNLAYDPVRKALLRSHPWSCAIKRASLAETTAPAWGRAHAYNLPSDFLRLHDDYYEDNALTKDWEIEQRQILTDDVSPLYIRYIYDLDDPNTMDALFREALSATMAYQMAEYITQSNSKVAAAEKAMKTAIREARRTNAIEKSATPPPDPSWITGRS